MNLLHRAIHDDKFWKRPALIGLAIVAAVLLFGCATQGAYWVKTHEPVAHKATRYVDKPCGRANWDGCANRFTGEIQIRRGLSEGQTWCVLNHELKHLAGYSHPGGSYGFAGDCGNGETL